MRLKIEILYILFLFSFRWTTAQPLQLNKSVCRAINNYVLYANEAMHTAHVMYGEFEQWNWNLNRFVQGECDTIAYPQLHSNILTNYDYYSTLPRDLYKNIFSDNVYIAYERRGKPLETVGKIENVLAELEKIRFQLFQYSSQQQYKTDPYGEQAYALLARAEVLYYDLYALQDKLRMGLKEAKALYIHSPADSSKYRVMVQMEKVIESLETVVRYVRIDQSTTESQNALLIANNLLADMERNRSQYLSGIAAIDSSALCPHKRYDAFVQRGKECVAVLQDFKNAALAKYQGLPRPAHYYYYNVDVLNKFNRYGDGLVRIFNRFIVQNNELYLHANELPKLFKVSVPNTKKDSTQKDSSKTLDNFAANHLVFLLDMSTSMADTSRMPVLLDAMRSLVKLMRSEDQITIITFSGRAKMYLPPTSAADKNKILQVINTLPFGGGSNVYDGLNLAYEVGLNNFIQGGNNRIIMATDGVLKVENNTRRLIQQGSNKGMVLSVFYIDKNEESTKKMLLQSMATKGKGQYRFIQKNTAEEQLLQEAQSVRKKNMEK